MSAATMGWVFDEVAEAVQPTLLSWRELAHSVTPVVALERPIPGIARCVIAPVPLLWLPAADRPAHHGTRRVRCLAADDEGRLAAPQLLFNGDAESLLVALRQCLARGGRPGPDEAAGLLAADSAATLRDPAHWGLWGPEGPSHPRTVAWQWAERMRRHAAPPPGLWPAPGPQHYLRLLGERLRACVDWVFAALPAGLRSAVPGRPQLGWGLARQVLKLAEAHGSNACRYAEQALRCEPLPTLRWIEAGGPLAQALFEGRSLPRELCRLAAIAPATVRHVARQALAVPDLPVSVWTVLLAAVDRLPPSRRPCGPTQWRELAAVAEVVGRELDVAEPVARGAAIEAVLAGARKIDLGARPGRAVVSEWQGHFGYAGAAEDFALLVVRLYRLLSAPGSPTRLPPAPADSAEAAEAEINDTALRLAAAFGQPGVRSFCDQWLALLPDLPPMPARGFSLRLLRSLDEVVRHGRALGNCVRWPHGVLDYLVRRIGFVAVEGGDGQPLGLVGMAVERCGARLLRDVDEALGPLDEPLPEATVAAAEIYLERMARDAARFERFVRVAEALAVLDEFG